MQRVCCSGFELEFSGVRMREKWRGRRTKEEANLPRYPNFEVSSGSQNILLQCCTPSLWILAYQMFASHLLSTFECIMPDFLVLTIQILLNVRIVYKQLRANDK